FRLPYQDDLQQLMLGSFKIGKQADLFECLCRKMMGFIDDKHRGEPFQTAIDNKVAKVEQQLTFVFSSGGQAEIADDVLQKLRRRKAAAKNVSVSDIFAL